MKRGKRGSAIRALVLALVISVTFGLPESSFAGTQSSPTADDVQYYTVTKDGKTVNTGIKSIVIDPNTYTNISRDPDINSAAEGSSTAPTVRLNDATMEKIVKKYVFPKWGVVAEGIFRDQADQLVTIEGSGMMSSSLGSKESFDRHFSYGRDGILNTYKDYDWALSDLASTLGTPPSKTGKRDTEMGEFKVLKGNVNNDEVVFSGIYPIKNLSEARTLMGKSLRACADDDNLTVDDFLGNSKDKTKKEYRLPAIADDKTGKGFASIVTCVNRAGDSWDYDYNAFGIAVYDIDVTPIAANNVNYIKAAQEYMGEASPLEAAQKAGVKGVYYDSQKSTARLNRITNNAPQTSTNTVSLAHNVSEQVSATTQETFTFGMDQQLGVDWRIGANSDPWGLNFKFTTTFRETWASMKSNGKTNTNQENRTVTTQVSLPGHTAASIDQNIEEITQEEDFQQPVVINYKVAIFAMSGDYFNGSLGVGYISPGRYDKEWMSVIFDGSDADEQNGCKALSSLYNRAVTNYSVAGYDGVHGKYSTWCDKGAWAEANKIDWNQIASDIRNDKRSSHILSEDGKAPAAGTNVIHDMASSLQFAETAATIHTDSNAMLTSVGEIVPLYDLKSVDIAKGNKVYEVKSGQGDQSIYLDSIELKGYDKDEVEFYGFNTVKGQWQISEKNPSDTQCFALRNDSVLGQVVDVTPNAESDAECTLEWVPDTNQTIASSEHPDGMSAEEIEAITRPQIKVRAKGGTTAVDAVKLTGEYTGPYDAENINLNKVLNVNVTDSENNALSVPIYWESDGSRGIRISENGDVSFTVPGSYRVRAFCRNNGVARTSDWKLITATAKAELHSMELDTAGMDEEALTLNDNNKTRTYDLNSFVSFKDQFENAWEGTDEEPLPKASFSLDVQDKSAARLDSEGFLTVSKAGTYKVTAKATDTSGKTLSDTATLRVTAQPWLSEIEFNRPDVGRNDLILNTPGDQIKIGGLKDLLDYYDQNGNEWTGSKPKVTFKIAEETSGAEIVAGGNYTFYAYQPGRYTIQPQIAGFDVDPVQIDVTANKNLVINVAAPSRQILSGDEEICLELERFLNGTTVFGETWKGDLPEMYFELDSGVEGARIETETIKDSKTGESIEIHNFICDTAGEYAVHVTPKQASAYKDDIDDIVINVVAYDRVERLGFSEISEETTGKSFTVNTYKDQYPVIALNGFVEYYDQNGNKIDPDKPKVVIPDIAFELVQYDDKGNAKAVDERDAVIKNGVLTIYTGGVYMVRVGVPKNLNIVQAEATVYAPDITWMHDFGDWVVTEPTCTEAGSRVRTCEDDNCPICKKEGEGYHETITDTIPAKGHHWGNIHEEYTENGVRYAAVKCKVCGEIRPSTRIRMQNSQIIVAPDSSSANRSATATCEEDGTLVLRRLTSGGTVHEYVNIPATGHHWNGSYVSDDDHAADCNHTGLEWIVCDDCGAVQPDSERVIPKTVHDYPVDEDGNIKWDTVVEPTCSTEGYAEVACTICGEVYRGRYEAPTGHTWGEEYVSDDEHAPTCSKEGKQWIECTACHAVKSGSEIPIPVTPHTYPTNDDGSYKWDEEEAPTCDKAGYKQVKCTVCDYQYRVELDATGHSMTHVDAKPASCEAAGNIEYWTCGTCGKFFSDEEGKNEIAEADVVISEKGHKLKHVEAKEAGCDEAGNIEHWACEECGKFFSDEEGTNEIAEADAVIPKTSHELTHVEAKEATCDEAGNIEHWTCSKCNKFFSDAEGKTEISADDVVISKKAHTLTAVKAKAATCAGEGYKAYWKCETCEKLFSDAAGTEEIDAPIAIPKKAHSIIKEKRVAPTCEKAGVKAHWICENCETLFADADGIEEITAADLVIPKKAHTLVRVKGTAATCEKKGTKAYWICEDCERMFSDEEGTEEIDDPIEIPKKAHSLTHIEAKDATCAHAGNIEYWTCSECGRFFSDEEGRTEIESDERIIPVNGDRHQETAQRNENDMPNTCTTIGGYDVVIYCKNCNAVISREHIIRPKLGHDWGEWVTTKEATETEPGEEKRTCKNDPSHVETRTIPIEGHVHGLTLIEAEDPTCEKAGNIQYYVCDHGDKPCGRYFKDEAGTVELTKDDITVAAKGHTRGSEKRENQTAATCTAPASYETAVYCTVCGEELSREKKTEGSALGHSYKDVAGTAVAATCTTDGRTADRQCSRCGDVKAGAKIDKLGHEWGDWTEVKASTCIKQGQEVRECKHDSNHKEYRYKTLLLHDMTRTAAKAATCTKPGNIEYYTCSECGGVFTDGAGKIRIDLEDTVVPANGHSWNAGVVTTKATTTKTGVRTYTCTVCKETKTATIPKLAKKANTLKVSGKTVKVKYKTVKKKKKVLGVTKVIKFTNKGQGTRTYVKSSGNNKIKVAKKTGKITVKKGIKKGTYKVKIKVKAKGNANYKASAQKLVTVTIKVK